jgi:hypothetical protein
MMTDWARALARIAKLKSCTQSADAAQAPAAPDPPRRLRDEPREEYAPSGSKPCP